MIQLKLSQVFKLAENIPGFSSINLSFSALDFRQCFFLFPPEKTSRLNFQCFQIHNSICCLYD